MWRINFWEMRERVILGFSGGIDSCASVNILQESGYQVTVLTLNTTGDQRLLDEARAKANDLKIDFDILNVEKQFKEEIQDYFIREYLAGRTPAPCTRCNPMIKWSSLLDYADRTGAEYIATGHYIRISQYNNRLYVTKALDPQKDQSYYLWGLSQQILQRALTPMGTKIKAEIKKDLIDKRESMGICFLNGCSYKHYITEM